MDKNKIDMTEPKRKLIQEQFTVGMDDVMESFRRFLAGRLADKLSPDEFISEANLAIQDLQSGVNTYTREHIPNILVGLPPVIYDMIRWTIPHISNVIFPAEFSKEVRDILEKKESKEK